jgi:hypothetical protein
MYHSKFFKIRSCENLDLVSYFFRLQILSFVKMLGNRVLIAILVVLSLMEVIHGVALNKNAKEVQPEGTEKAREKRQCGCYGYCGCVTTMKIVKLDPWRDMVKYSDKGCGV